ncbi:MAG: PD-(D/E)XK nuclease family protein, partial [Candidatus Paceibacteria bacterium]
IKHWSYSSLIAFLRNPLAWHKRYVEHVYDLPSTPAAAVGRAGHKALEHYYRDRVPKEQATQMGLAYLRTVPDFELDFGKAESARARKAKRAAMEREYLQAIGFYLRRAPRHAVVGVEVSAKAAVPGVSLPVKAVSDLVVESRTNPGALDIVDHKFVDSFTAPNTDKPLFVLQALFNYYTVREEYGVPVARFILQECKKRRNRSGGSQMRRHIIRFDECADDFTLFQRLLKDATEEISRRKRWLPNPSDMFEGKNSFEIYRMGLAEGEESDA